MSPLNVEEWQRICFDSYKNYAGERTLLQCLYLTVRIIVGLTLSSSFWRKVELDKSVHFWNAVELNLWELVMWSSGPSCWIPLGFWSEESKGLKKPEFLGGAQPHRPAGVEPEITSVVIQCGLCYLAACGVHTSSVSSSVWAVTGIWMHLDRASFLQFTVDPITLIRSNLPIVCANGIFF